MTLGEAVVRGILPAPKYVTTVYQYQKTLAKYQARVDNLRAPGIQDVNQKYLDALRRGETVECPTYDYAAHNRAAETITVRPAKVIVVEGILIFAEPELCRRLDIKIFVDTDADVRILRRIVRDTKERGRSLDSVVAQYLATVKPMHEQFVEPSKKNANLIVPEGGKNLIALEMIINRIQRHIDASAD